MLHLDDIAVLLKDEKHTPRHQHEEHKLIHHVHHTTLTPDNGEPRKDYCDDDQKDIQHDVTPLVDIAIVP